MTVFFEYEKVTKQTFLGLACLTLALGSCGQPNSASGPAAPQVQTQAVDGCNTTNAALGKSARASSSENEGFLGAGQAVDSDLTTRWGSQRSDNEWLQVDLGSVQSICGVELRWEAAYAKTFRIDVSGDGQTWTPASGVLEGKEGQQSFKVSGTGQYVRMQGLTRAGGYGYSLFDFQVFTDGNLNPPPPPTDPTPPPGPTGPGITRVVGRQGNWQLSVDGAPYVVKGLTWGPPVSEAAQRMPDLRQMGVNTIRTWGTDASSKTLFDAAVQNGLKVVAGFWLQPGGGPGAGGCVNYVTDDNYKATMLTEIKKWVGTYKDDKAVLMWNVGNESILGLQNCFGGAELESQRTAYAKFVNEAAKAIHAIDKNHPVTNTDAWTGAWPYLKANAPDLDLYAVNAYNAVCKVKQDWLAGGYSKPYIITEGGPAGEWEVPDDANGVADEPTDVQKAEGYKNAWNCITGHKGVALGATLFHYGTEGDFGGVWFNLIPNGEKRLSYYAVRQMYGGAPASNTPPVITNMALSNPTSVPAGGTFTVSANVSDPNGDPIQYTMGYNSKYINGAGGIISANIVPAGAGRWTVTAPPQLGVWKIYLYARDGKGNIGIESRSLRVVAPPVAGTNIALNRPTDASSFQPEYNGQTFFPQHASDGNLTSRWASEWSDPQWLRIDLGAGATFNHIQLIWEDAYASEYQLQVSDDGQSWRDLVPKITGGDGGADDFDVGNVTGRYVRMLGSKRGTGFGYALYEFGVYRR